MKRKKHCKSAACDVTAVHLSTETNDGQKVWECQNCGQLTPIRNRKPSAAALALEADLDRLFAELAGRGGEVNV